MQPTASHVEFRTLLRYQEATVDGVKFALFDMPLSANRSLNLPFPDHTVIVLEPLTAQEDIAIAACNYIGLSTLIARRGVIATTASGNVYSLGETVRSPYEREISAKKEVHILKISPTERLEISTLFRQALNMHDSDLFIQACNLVCEAIRKSTELRPFVSTPGDDSEAESKTS